VGLMRFIYVRSMSFQSTSKFLPGTRTVFGSLLFIADKMGYLNLQEPESWEIVGLGTDIFPLASAEVDLACEARLGHGSSRSGGGRITLTTTRYVALMQQIQSTSHHWSPTPMAIEKSLWWGRVNPLPPLPTKA
jgi:hypothetical protein